ncbi:MAG: c-type cytochrome [Thiohalomonadaceae bacterium]
MKKLASVVFVLIGAVGVAHAAAPAGDAAAGQGKAAVCAACHGMDGNSLVPLFPKLAGQHTDYIVKQLAAFQSGERKDETMAPMAAPLSDQDVADLAAYFNSQKASVGVANPELAEAGGKIYRGGIAGKGVSACMACHGPSGAGNPAANFPSLSGQQAAYVAKALRDFRSGARATDPAGMMRNLAVKMSDAEIDAVAEFVAGLH